MRKGQEQAAEVWCGIPSPEGPFSPVVPFPPQEHMTAGGNCQTFSSSTVISYSNTGDGAPKVYQETSEMRSAPGGVSWAASHLPEKAALKAAGSSPAFLSQDWAGGGLLSWCGVARASEGVAEGCVLPHPRSGRLGGPCGTQTVG